MGLDVDKLMNWPFQEVEQTYTTRDSILYALGVGLNMDPLDEQQLKFCYEDGMEALPTMAVVLASPGFWVKDPEAGIDWVRVLHGEQGLRIHKPLPPAATVVATNKIVGLVDKGEGKGALIQQERTLVEKDSGDALATLTSTTFARGNGGFGQSIGESKPVHAMPEREPDQVCALPTLPQAALIYRLSGDYNPLHADPKVATAANFKAPILHGLCTLGVAGHAILRTCCDYDTSRFRALDLRFSAPVYPGETISTEMWRDGDVISFRSRVLERDVVVLNNGRAEVA
jgi:acyl dehydratase